MPAKKEKKSGGGIFNVVTKQTAAGKFGANASSSSVNKIPALSPSLTAALSAVYTPPVQSPELGPATSPSDNGVMPASPAFEAVSAPSPSVAASTVPSFATNEWARQFFTGSPGNLISLNGESPPTLPSSYEDATRSNDPAWMNERSSALVPQANSPSPPAPPRRPLSMQTDPKYLFPLQDQPPPPQQKTLTDQPMSPGQRPLSVRYRRSSVHSHSHFARTRTGSHPPPPPHHPQAHFFGVPELDLNSLVPMTGMKPGEGGHVFALDTMPRLNGTGTDHVVLAGYEGGLELYSVTKRGLDHAVGLKGLRGGVVNAKVLPWTATTRYGHSAVAQFPLIAVVVHGPVLPKTPAADSYPEANHIRLLDEDRGRPVPSSTTASSVGPGSPRLDQQPMYLRDQTPYNDGSRSAIIDAYQTTVEVYSLRTGRFICTLLRAPKIAINTGVSILSPLFRPPPPSGALQLRADSGTVLVASGVTGECWIFRQLTGPTQGNIASPFFACSGKVWTSLQHRPVKAGDVHEDRDPAWSSSSSPLGPAAPTVQSQTAILSLAGRWMAFSPPAPSSQMTLRAVVATPVMGKGPGLSTVTPPPPPSTNCSVDLPISDSVVNKIMRETTQELISGAKWVGQQGLQAWNAYWNKPGQLQQSQQQQQQPQPPLQLQSLQHQLHMQQLQHQQPRSPQLGPQPWSSRQEASHFPPTHGAGAEHAVAKDIGLVSVMDMETIGTSSSVHPFATFQTPLGCSFLSFSPSGLNLFTASNKGDVQTVWDLMRIQYTKYSPLQGVATAGPHGGGGGGGGGGAYVRQVAHFSRMTVARIVDVSWTRPCGGRIAMVTERGTVHLLDMPPSAFSWPPPRRRRPGGQMDGSSGPAEPSSNAATTAVSIASSALGAALEAAKPLIARPRRSSANLAVSSLSGTGATIVDSANQGGRAIAATISNSLEKTGHAIKQLRHTGENRVSLPPGSRTPNGSWCCVAWLSGRKYPALVVLGDGMMRLFASRPQQRSFKTMNGTAGSGRADKYRTPKGSKFRDFGLPPLPDGLVSAHARSFVELGISPDDIFDLTDKDLESTVMAPVPAPSDFAHMYGRTHLDINAATHAHAQTLTHTDSNTEVSSRSGPHLLEASIPQAEIESSAPYQPFHTDRRVALFEYVAVPSRGGNGDGGQAGQKPAIWAFGQKIAAVQVMAAATYTGPAMGEEDEDSHQYPYQHPPTLTTMETVMRVGRLSEDEIVVTTRRRRCGGDFQREEDGFFEDDCEVLDFADQRV